MSFANSHRRPLKQTVVERASGKVHASKSQRQLERLLLHLETGRVDVVADDLVYHRFCYKEFTHPRALQQLEDGVEEKGDAYIAAYKQLFDAIKSSVLEGKKRVHA